MSANPPPEGYYPITGIPLVPDAHHPIPLRRELNEWYKDPLNGIQVSLFIQALDRFQKTSFEQKLSYFQVAGIHGQPGLAWDSAPPPPKEDEDDDGPVYCTHGQPTFPTWHRPYVLLYEQVLHNTMLEIIADRNFPATQRTLWSAAANQWRLPYWDYAETPAMPELATLKTVVVHRPGGGTLTFDPNPLWTYRIATGKPMGDESMVVTGRDGKKIDYRIKTDSSKVPWDACIGTSRHAIVSDEIDPKRGWVAGFSNSDEVTRQLSCPPWPKPDPHFPKAAGTIRENVYRLFTPEYLRSWETFASTKFYKHGTTQWPREWLSLEMRHNMIHLLVGGANMETHMPDLVTGTGHMCWVPVAAFDPLFWHHHCFIDRVLAIWQTLTEDKLWFDEPMAGDPKPGDPLQPFHKAAFGREPKDYEYSSDDTRDWTKMNYTYEHLEPKLEHLRPDGSLDKDAYFLEVKETINRLYSTTRTEVLGETGPKPGTEHAYNDYIINVVYNRFAINGGEPYIIHLFVGRVDPDNTVAYRDHPNRVGSVYTFSRPLAREGGGGSTCKNCQRQADANVLSCAQIPITGAMLKDSRDASNRGLRGFGEDDVEAYLKDLLSWKVVKVTGEEIPLRELPDLKIGALAGTGYHSDESRLLSTYQDYRVLWQATRNKDGGAEQGDEVFTFA